MCLVWGGSLEAQTVTKPWIAQPILVLSSYMNNINHSNIESCILPFTQCIKITYMTIMGPKIILILCTLNCERKVNKMFCFFCFVWNKIKSLFHHKHKRVIGGITGRIYGKFQSYICGIWARDTHRHGWNLDPSSWPMYNKPSCS